MNEVIIPETINITAEHGRLDLFLSDRFDITRSRVKKLVDGGDATVNGKTVKAGYMLKPGDVLTVNIAPEPPQPDLEPQNIALDVIYEDSHLAVINKPQGMVVHPAAGVYKDTLVNALLYRFGQSLSDTGDAVRPGIVHRLDKDTSGLLVVAKTTAAHYLLAAQIADKTAVRKYKALAEGVVKPDSGVIDCNIIRDPKNRKAFTTAPSGGKTAVTHFKVLERYDKRTLLEFELKTGRTHQIRVHARHIGHPVTGDKVYGFKAQEYKLSGQLLHSYFLSFTHPATGERVSFCTELPDYFLSIIDKQSQTIYKP